MNDGISISIANGLIKACCSVYMGYDNQADIPFYTEPNLDQLIKLDNKSLYFHIQKLIV